MARVTSKLRLAIPKAVAARHGIEPGDELDWQPADEIIRVVPPRNGSPAEKPPTAEERLTLFDRATQRQRRREAGFHRRKMTIRKETTRRGRKREQLYVRGRPR